MNELFSQMGEVLPRSPEVAVATIDLSPETVDATIEDMEAKLAEFDGDVDGLEDTMANQSELKETLEKTERGKLKLAPVDNYRRIQYF